MALQTTRSWIAALSENAGTWSDIVFIKPHQADNHKELIQQLWVLAQQDGWGKKELYNERNRLLQLQAEGDSAYTPKKGRSIPRPTLPEEICEDPEEGVETQKNQKGLIRLHSGVAISGVRL